jgi:tRNA(Ile)-lysidine synthase
VNINSMKKLETEILIFIDRYNLISDGEKILLGLSGGPDSVFALHFFMKYKNRLKIELACIHFNHMLRGKESDDDENFVRELCKSNEIELHVMNLDVKKYSSENNYSIEEAARHLRYREFNSMMKKTGSSKIVTAHNSNDNTETILLNSIKGTGLSGYSGIPVKRDYVIRPFLSVTKKKIIEYLDNSNYKYCIDSSNYLEDFQRNYLRINIIPEIENNLNPSLHKSVLTTSLNLSSALEYLNILVEKVVGQSIIADENFVDLDLNHSELDNEYLLGEVLKKICSNHLNIEFNRKLFDQVLELKNGQVGKQCDLENNWYVIKERECIRFNHSLIVADDRQMILRAGEIVEMNGVRIGCEYLESDFEAELQDDETEIISADKLDDIFILRKWKSGDKFQPLGMKGTKKISDFLTEQKVPSSDKNNYLVLTNNETIVWVVGLRISEKFKLTEKTKKAMKLWMK